MLDVLVAVALAATPAAPAEVSDLPGWCTRASTVDRSTAPDGAQWAVCQTEDPFGEDRVYVRPDGAGRWVEHRPPVGFRGPVPLLALNARTCLVGGPALTLLTDGGAEARVLVAWDGTAFEGLTPLGEGRYAAHRNDGREWRGTTTGQWRSYPQEARGS